MVCITRTGHVHPSSYNGNAQRGPLDLQLRHTSYCIHIWYCIRILHTAYCIRLTAYCIRHTAYCTRHIVLHAACTRQSAYGLRYTAYCILHTSCSTVLTPSFVARASTDLCRPRRVITTDILLLSNLSILSPFSPLYNASSSASDLALAFQSAYVGDTRLSHYEAGSAWMAELVRPGVSFPGCLVLSSIVRCSSGPCGSSRDQGARVHGGKGFLRVSATVW